MTTRRTLLMLALLAGGATIAVAQPADRSSTDDRRARLLEQRARIEAQLEALDAQRDTPPPRDRALREGSPHGERFAENRRKRQEEMNQLRESDLEEYRRRIETMQALRRAHQLAAEVAALEDAGKVTEANSVRAELRAEAEFVFDRTIERQQAEIAKNEERLEAAKARLGDAVSNRDARLDDRIEKAIERARQRRSR